MGADRVGAQPSQVEAQPSQKVARKVSPARRVEPRLTVGSTDDPLEAEAERWAETAMSQLSGATLTAPTWLSDAPVGRIARRSVGPEGGPLDAPTSREIAIARGDGRPLDARLRPRMEQAFGADFSDVRVHVGARSDELNRRLQAKAFTTGPDVFIRRKDYAPHMASGQTLLAHELAHTLQQGGTRVVRRTDGGVIRRYTDIPDPATWKTDSSVSGSPRSKHVKAIGEALGEYHLVRDSTDLSEPRLAIERVLHCIDLWEGKKTTAGVAASVRKDPIAELKTVLQAKLQANIADHTTELAPVSAEYKAAAIAKNWSKTKRLAKQLYDALKDVLLTAASDVLNNTADGKVAATVLFTAPYGVVGTPPFNSITIKARASWSFLTKPLADKVIEQFVVPFAKSDPNQVLAMLEHRPFRDALLAKATPLLATDLLAEMPALRIAQGADHQAAANKAGATPTIEEIADSCFAVFLGDAPTTDLGYVTNAISFEPNRFLLGDSSQGKRASCMVLSVMLKAVLKMVLPAGDPAAAVNSIVDPSPMLTKPLASIGTGTGILTRDATFKGNVDKYDTQVGHATVNRIFFGDGHEWLQIGTKEFDPTLGISGPVGTVRGAVEPWTWIRAKTDKYTTTDNGGMKAERNKKKPPGGAPMLFNRSVSIT